MNGCLPDEPTLQRLRSEIEAAPPRPHHSALMANLGGLLPGCEFRFALTRGGWYRPGGIIRPDGERITDDLERWAEAELEACGDDLAECIERHDGEGLLATRHTGRSHYFVGVYGTGAADFVQLEIEELQEVLDRRLVDPANLPVDLAELTDPVQPLSVDAQPVDRPYYRFRRLTDMRQILARQINPGVAQSPLARFMAEWELSQAGARGHFADRWVIGIREHQDRYRNTVLSASPISRYARKLKTFHWQPDARGVALADQLHAFDKVAGYPTAWYFHLVAGGLVPRTIAYAVKADLEQGFSYLSESGTSLLDRWVVEPYGV
jgi:hypothetical protein